MEIAKKIGLAEGALGWLSLCAVSIALVPGCSLQAGAEGESAEHETAGRVSESVAVSCPPGNYDACAEMTDVSGTIKVRTYECRFTPSQQLNIASCQVEPGFVLVGGGAQIEGVQSAQPGALLFGGYPHTDKRTWIAESKDHVRPYNHRLRAFAIGLQLKNMTETALRTAVRYTIANSAGNVSQPSACAMVINSSEILIGGGARAIFEVGGPGQLLLRSNPSVCKDPTSGKFIDGWLAESKDHVVSDPGQVSAYAISIDTCPAGYAGGCLKNFIRPWNSFSGVGYQGAIIPGGSTFITTSIGAHSNYMAGGRLLTDLFPRIDLAFGGVEAWTKDHEVVDKGFVTADLVGLAKQ
jgi:hypothetical protein